MASDSGTYSPETLARRAKIAEALIAPSKQPIYSWMQGLAEIGQGAVGGMMLNRVERDQRAGESAQTQALAKLLGGSAPTAPAAVDPVSVPAASAGDTSVPRGIRNNNPLNIEAGGFTQGQPGFAGSDGRFARFDTPEAGVGAANKLLETYQNKYGLNTPAGIIGRWAPSADGNNVNSYASAVAGQLGIGPNDTVTPEMRPQLIAAMGQHENGRPIGNVDAALMKSAQVAQAAPVNVPVLGIPGAVPSTIPAQDSRAQVAAMLNDKNPYVRKMGQSLAQGIIAKQVEGEKPTDEMREYDLYRRQGGKDTFFDYKAGLKRAGAINNSVTVDQKPELSFDTEAGKLQAKRFDELAADGQNAKQMISDIDTLTDLGKNIGTGKVAEVKASLGPYAEALGVKIDGLSDIQAFEAVVNRVAPNLRVKGSGAQSDYELKNFLKSLPNLGNTTEGNAIASSVMKGLYDNKIAAAEIGSRALNKEITRSQADKMLRELPDPMQPYRDYKKANSTKSVSPVPAATGQIDPAALEEARRRGLIK